MRVWPVEKEAISNGSVSITGSDARHILGVLRKKVGDKLKISTNGGETYDIGITEICGNAISADILAGPFKNALKKPEIFLALSISKQQVMETVCQKAVELGCEKLILTITRNSIADSISEGKMERLRKIAHEAYKQSGRPSPLLIKGPVKITELPAADLKLVLWEEEEQNSLASILKTSKKPSQVCVLVGPTSGLNLEEVEKLTEEGFKPAGLGKLILRTETAAISVISIINYHYGRMEP